MATRDDKHAEHEFLQKLNSTLDNSIESLDPQIEQRLLQARRKAIAEIPSPRRLRPVTMLAMAAGICAIVLGVTLWLPSTQGTMPALEDVPILSAADDFEFLQELEFYEYLEVEERRT